MCLRPSISTIPTAGRPGDPKGAEPLWQHTPAITIASNLCEKQAGAKNDLCVDHGVDRMMCDDWDVYSQPADVLDSQQIKAGLHDAHGGADHPQPGPGDVVTDAIAADDLAVMVELGKRG